MAKKAEMALSTLILLTAMILVSAIVFMVFLETTSSVRDQTHTVGETTRQNVGTGLHIQKIYALDGSLTNDLDYFYLEIKMPYASDEIKLADTLLLMTLPNVSGEYSYNSTINCSEDITNTNVYSIANDTHSTHFGAQWVQGSYTYEGTMSAGEYVRLCFKSPRNISKVETIGFRIISKYGMEGSITVKTPTRIYEKYTYLFP